jgi:fatty acid desaturase
VERSQETGRADAVLAPDELRALQQRSDRKGLLRFAGHLGLIAATGWVYARALAAGGPLGVALALVAYGFTLVTMFAAMHEAVHRTAFRSTWLNDAVGWVAGVLSFYNSTFYRHYHGWHHRFTQIPGRDPELEDPKPTSVATYLIEVSGVTWWMGKLRTHAALARGRVGGFGFLNDKTGPAAVRSVRAQLGVYGAALLLSAAVGRPLFVLYWLLPVAAAQPLLRAILLAEHTGCSQDDDALTNTRTTLASLPVRFLMWNMPYHAEHHRYPALPFFALPEVHGRLGPRLAHVARDGYVAFNRELVAGLAKRAGQSPGGVP